MPVLFALTLGLGAALLFSIQPMAAKVVLPRFGGAPAVWNTCLVFFQLALLAGYAYAHATASLRGIRRQAAVHAVVLAMPLALLGSGLFSGRLDLPGAAPVLQLLAWLATTVGLPFFVVATTAPVLQRWYARSGGRDPLDPYALYVASNLGSLVGLLGYPLVVEPNWPLSRQGELWARGYCGLAALSLACIALAATRAGSATEPFDEDGDSGRPGWRIRLRWIALALLPSSLLQGVTTYLGNEVASFPMLWVIPLALYLATFILVFAHRPRVSPRLMARLLPLLVMPLALVLGAGLVWPFLMPLHLLTFLVAAMVCHGELARLRPDPRHLTSFYLAIAAGGALGGAFNALLAPRIFVRIAEYPLGLVLACLTVPGVFTTSGRGWPRRLAAASLIPAILLAVLATLARGPRGWSETLPGASSLMLVSGLAVFLGWTHRRDPLRFALGVGALLLASGMTAGVNGRVIHEERTFFGLLQVTEDDRSRSHRLFHGRTLHGQQSMDPAHRRDPSSYFHRNGPIGQVFETHPLPGPEPRVAIVGLGAGALACYARPGERWTFYEIDPAVAGIARDGRYFTFLADCRAETWGIVLGDARLRIAEAADHSFDLIILDAFSADAMPVHLMTREALRLYRRKLARGGLLAFHISNRYLDLGPVLGHLARDAGLPCRIRADPRPTAAEAREGKQGSIWGVMAESEADLGPLATDPRWQPPRRDPGAVWRDDFSDLVRHIALRPGWTTPRPPARGPAILPSRLEPPIVRYDETHDIRGSARGVGAR